MGVLHHLHPILFFSKSNEGHLISGLSRGGKFPGEPTKNMTEINLPGGITPQTQPGGRILIWTVPELSVSSVLALWEKFGHSCSLPTAINSTGKKLSAPTALLQLSDVNA